MSDTSKFLFKRGIEESNFIFLSIYALLMSAIFFRENDILAIGTGTILIYLITIGIKRLEFYNDHIEIIYITRLPLFGRHQSVFFHDLYSAEYFGGAGKSSPMLTLKTKNGKTYRIIFYLGIDSIVKLFKILNDNKVKTLAKLRDENQISVFRKEIPKTIINV
jgi:hypothetical protein